MKENCKDRTILTQNYTLTMQKKAIMYLKGSPSQISSPKLETQNVLQNNQYLIGPKGRYFALGT